MSSSSPRTMETERQGEVVLAVQGLRKEFPGVVALDGVDFDVRRGEVHALLGANGAGKSTLIKIVSSLYRPDAGKIYLDRNAVDFGSTSEAIDAGISVIYQDFALVPDLEVTDNIFLGNEVPGRLFTVNKAAEREEAQRLLDIVGATFPTTEMVSSLGTGQRQQVEIAKALRSNAKVLILDEPTASLSHAESERLFEVIRRLRKQGVAIVYVSHRLEEIAPLVERVTVLRDGVSVGTYPVEEIDREKIVSLITGQSHHSAHKRAAAARQRGETPLLEVKDLGREGEFKDVSFDLYPGEVLVLTGLVGAGRTEILETLFGLRHLDGGELLISGAPIAPRTPREAIQAGLALIPEDRRGQGVSTIMSIADNIALPILRRFLGRAGLDKRRLMSHAEMLIEKLSIRTPGPSTSAGSLSGGNQQKVVLAKWLSTDAQVFLFDEPTQGVDVGAKAEIYGLIDGLASEGKGVLIVSSDLEEVLAVADRVLAMREGRIIAEFENKDLDASRVVDAITNG